MRSKSRSVKAVLIRLDALGPIGNVLDADDVGHLDGRSGAKSAPSAANMFPSRQVLVSSATICSHAG